MLLHDALHKKEVNLRPDEWLALVTWIDANAPYYDAFLNKRPDPTGPPRREVAPNLSTIFTSAGTTLLPD